MSLLLLFSLGGGGTVVDLPSVTPGRVYIPSAYARHETEAEKYARRVALGIIVPDKPGEPIRVVEKGRKGAETLAGDSARLAAVQSKLAQIAEKQAQIAEKQTRAKAVASIARHEARQARLAREQAANQQVMAILLQHIEETDIAFVAAMLMEA